MPTVVAIHRAACKWHLAIDVEGIRAVVRSAGGARVAEDLTQLDDVVGGTRSV